MSILVKKHDFMYDLIIGFSALLERLDLRAIPGLKGPAGILEDLENPEKLVITTDLDRLVHLDKEGNPGLQDHMVHWGTVEKF